MDKFYICNLCNREYSSKYSLSNHKRIKHKNEKTPETHIIYTDDNKSNTLKGKTSRKRAVCEPVNIFSFKCEYCDNKYKHKQSLKRHLLKCLKRKKKMKRKE